MRVGFVPRSAEVKLYFLRFVKNLVPGGSLHLSGKPLVGCSGTSVPFGAVRVWECFDFVLLKPGLTMNLLSEPFLLA